MLLDILPRKLIVLFSALLILGGLILGAWTFSQIMLLRGASTTVGESGNLALASNLSEAIENPRQQSLTNDSNSEVSDSEISDSEISDRDDGSSISTISEATAVADNGPLVISLDASLPKTIEDAIRELVAAPNSGVVITATSEISGNSAGIAGASETPLALATVVAHQGVSGDQQVFTQYYAAAARLDTIDLETTLEDLESLWRGSEEETVSYESIAVISDTIPALTQLLGEPNLSVKGYETTDEVKEAVWAADGSTLTLLPFEELIPQLAVFAVDGQTPVENDSKFDPTTYPLVVEYTISVDGASTDQMSIAEELLAQLPPSNRDPSRLTVLAMTGVTAMVRMTAAKMDEFGPEWVAEQVGPELAAADITHISNEVPFVEGCVTNTSSNNLTFCSPPEYMAALRSVGVDIIGLTGNHQNDYGRDDALLSLEFYAEEELPIYGGGINKEEAFAPFYLEHNGNRLAFLGANSFGPQFAFATDNGPGSAEFDLNIMSATIRSIHEKDLADLVFAEIQYQESYQTVPLGDQRLDFNALIRAGADVVTGVQSHVPQSIEFTEGRLILYGLGNLFFDQMWSLQTREGLIVKHTIYNGRHISTQILTTMLHDYGQPQWTTPEERRNLLTRVFDSSYWE